MREYSGTYNDGKSAAAQQVSVRLTDHSLIMDFGEDDRGFKSTKEWSFESLSSHSPIDPRVPTQLGSSLELGALLFVNDQIFARKILESAPHLSNRAAIKKVLYPMFSIAAVVVAMIAAIWIFDVDIFNPIARTIPKEMRADFGKSVISGMIRGKKVCDKPEGLAALKKMQKRLETGIDEKIEFTVTVAKLGIVNAFAAPGEQLMITGELIEKASSPEEVAGIFAHEMGHGIKLHADAGFIRAVGLTVIFTAIFGSDPGILASLGFNLMELQNSRSKEREADRIALDILRKAQISPKALLKFHEKLDHSHGDEGSTLRQIGNILSTHPSSPERIALIKSQKEWPTKPILTDDEWKALKGICKK